jgi:hypothetical protein
MWLFIISASIIVGTVVQMWFTRELTSTIGGLYRTERFLVFLKRKSLEHGIACELVPPSLELPSPEICPAPKEQVSKPIIAIVRVRKLTCPLWVSLKHDT